MFDGENTIFTVARKNKKKITELSTLYFSRNPSLIRSCGFCVTIELTKIELASANRLFGTFLTSGAGDRECSRRHEGARVEEPEAEQGTTSR